jgi:hypothetical protein
MDFKNDIIQQLESNRPNLPPSSATTYASLLLNLIKKMDLSNTLESFIIYKNDILSFIENKITSLQSKKTFYPLYSF